MTQVNKKELKWKFQIGASLIDFPNPLGSIQENKQLLCQHFPQLRWTSVFEEDARLQNGAMIVPVIAPPVKTNG